MVSRMTVARSDPALKRRKNSLKMWMPSVAMAMRKTARRSARTSRGLSSTGQECAVKPWSPTSKRRCASSWAKVKASRSAPSEARPSQAYSNSACDRYTVSALAQSQPPASRSDGASSTSCGSAPACSREKASTTLAHVERAQADASDSASPRPCRASEAHEGVARLSRALTRTHSARRTRSIRSM